MKIPTTILSSIITVFVYSFFINGMENNISQCIDEVDEGLDDLQSNLVIEIYNRHGINGINEYLSTAFSKLIINIADKLICNHKRHDIIVALVTHLLNISNESFLKDNNFELALSLFRNLRKHKSYLNEKEKKILHDLWEELPLRLQGIFRIEQSHLIFSEALHLNVQKIIACFDKYAQNQVGRLYDSEYKQKIDIISKNSEDKLKQIVNYFFVHYDEYTLVLEDVLPFIEFLFPDKTDSAGNDIIKMILKELGIQYPEFSLLTENYADIWINIRTIHLMTQLIFDLKSFE